MFCSRRPLVAVDPELPAQRLDTIIRQLELHGRRAGLLISDAEHLRESHAVADTHGLEVVTITEGIGLIDGTETPATPSTVSVAHRVRENAPADPGLAVTSIQFTSGSTGTPKGVLHPNTMWLCDAELIRDGFGARPGRRIALSADQLRRGTQCVDRLAARRCGCARRRSPTTRSDGRPRQTRRPRHRRGIHDARTAPRAHHGTVTRPWRRSSRVVGHRADHHHRRASYR
ncbi:long-chain fatty acid--CoA ligase [Gordonia bronchialis]|nr:AMP-binding protein [Gordonia bronchialis]MCC3325887.1 long-chain fatty acid--CoA ligase [Gordonia bronchialis]